jgi:hypothetical protein
MGRRGEDGALLDDGRMVETALRHERNIGALIEQGKGWADVSRQAGDWRVSPGSRWEGAKDSYRANIGRSGTWTNIHVFVIALANRFDRAKGSEIRKSVAGQNAALSKLIALEEFSDSIPASDGPNATETLTIVSKNDRETGRLAEQVIGEYSQHTTVGVKTLDGEKGTEGQGSSTGQGCV